MTEKTNSISETDGQTREEKRIKEWTHIPEIGYYEEPPVSINDVMIKYFHQSEESILNSMIPEPTAPTTAD